MNFPDTKKDVVDDDNDDHFGFWKQIFVQCLLNCSVLLSFLYIPK